MWVKGGNEGKGWGTTANFSILLKAVLFIFKWVGTNKNCAPGICVLQLQTQKLCLI